MSITSGAHPNRSNDTYPDDVQEMREQARLDHDFAIGKAAERPSFTRLGPDRKSLSEDQLSNLTIAEAKEAGLVEGERPETAEPEVTTESVPQPAPQPIPEPTPEPQPEPTPEPQPVLAPEDTTTDTSNDPDVVA